MIMEIEKKVQEVVKDQTGKAIELAQGVKITSLEKMNSAVELLVKIKKAEKLIVGEKEKMTKPLNESLKNIRAFFKPFEVKIGDAKSVVQQKITDYQYILEKKEEEKAKKIEEKVEKGEMDFEKAGEKLDKIETAQKYEAEEGKVSFRTTKEVIVEDENKIPRQYLSVDMVKVRRDALAGINIEGVKVVEKKTPVVNC